MITVITFTYNDAAAIEKFLTNTSFADEVIIIDNNSSDNTLELAEQFNTVCLKRDFDTLKSQKDFAISKASHPWILYLEIDELISKNLRNEIKTITSTNTSSSSYHIRRRLNFMGKVLNHSGANTVLKNRLFHKESTSNLSKILKSTLTKNYRSFDSFNMQLTQHAKNESKKLAEKDTRPNLYHFIIKPFSCLIKHYLLKLGFLDGKEGFIYSYLQAFSMFKRYLYLWLNYRNLE